MKDSFCSEELMNLEEIIERQWRLCNLVMKNWVMWWKFWWKIYH